MPVMDGIQFLETFRKTDKAAVVIMVSARTSTSDFNEAKRKGADYFFMKPLDATMLKLRLGAAIDAALKSR
jgi:DNA-binding response OmpR family regulator